MGVSQESILFLFVSSGGTRGEKSSSGRVRELEEREWEEGGEKIWIGSGLGKLNVSIWTVYGKWRPWGTIIGWALGPCVERNRKEERWWQTYLTLPVLLFLSCSSRRAFSCSSAMDISSSMLVISSLARRRFSWEKEIIWQTLSFILVNTEHMHARGTFKPRPLTLTCCDNSIHQISGPGCRVECKCWAVRSAPQSRLLHNKSVILDFYTRSLISHQIKIIMHRKFEHRVRCISRFYLSWFAVRDQMELSIEEDFVVPSLLEERRRNWKHWIHPILRSHQEQGEFHHHHHHFSKDLQCPCLSKKWWPVKFFHIKMGK